MFVFFTFNTDLINRLCRLTWKYLITNEDLINPVLLGTLCSGLIHWSEPGCRLCHLWMFNLFPLIGSPARCLARGRLHVEEGGHCYWHVCSQPVWETLMCPHGRQQRGFYSPEHLSGLFLPVLLSSVSKIWNIRRGFFFSVRSPLAEMWRLRGAWSRFDSLMWGVLFSI